MVVNTLLSIGVAMFLLYVVATLSKQTGVSGNATTVVQTVINAFFGAALFTADIVGPIAIAIIVLLPALVKGIALLWFKRIGNKVLSGDYGQEAQWAGELVKEGDIEFVEASKKLGSTEMREIGIVCEDKSELREEVIERARSEN